MGEVRVNGEKIAAEEALSKHGLKPVSLKSKEGLALLNGTQFMNAYGVWSVRKVINMTCKIPYVF